jgi:hypothetical protein
MSSGMSANTDNALPGPIGETFGAFEPRFYGVSFLLTTPIAFRAWLSNLGVFRNSSEPTLSVFEDTCLRTAIEHETRHFHDALISPFANGILMLRMMATFNGLKALNRGSKTGANCIPIPLTNWTAKGRQERSEWLAEVSNDPPPGLVLPLRPFPLSCTGGSAHRPEPGVFSIDADSVEAELNAFAEATIGAYKKVSDLMKGPAVLLRTHAAFQSYTEDAKRGLAATLNPRNVFEASALAVQLQAAWTIVGEEAANVFGSYLLASDLGYAKAFRRIAKSSGPRDKAPMVDPIRISAVAVWCLLGDPGMNDGFDPAVRLARLLPLLDQRGGISATDSIADLWDNWDQSLKVKNWRTAVTSMRERTTRSIAKYVRASKEPDEPEGALFVTVLEAYLADQIRATELLLKDPDSYVHTQRYVERDEDVLPIPLISVELGEDFVAPLDTFPANDAVRLPRIVDKDGVRGWSRAVTDRHKPPRARLLDAALELEFRCKMCDVVFSDEAMSPIDREVLLKSVAKTTGMAPLFIF